MQEVGINEQQFVDACTSPFAKSKTLQVPLSVIVCHVAVLSYPNYVVSQYYVGKTSAVPSEKAHLNASDMQTDKSWPYLVTIH